MGCKYPGLISAVIPFGALSLFDCKRSRSSRPWSAMSLGWAVVMRALAGQECDRHRQPGLSARQFDLSRPAAGMQPERSKWSAAHGRKANLAQRVRNFAGRRRRPVRLAVAALTSHWRRSLSCVRDRGRLALLPLGIRGLPVCHLVVADPSTRPVLAAALASAGGARGWGPTGPEPGLVDSPGHDHDDRAAHEPDLHLDGPGGLQRVDRRSRTSCDETSREAGTPRSRDSTPNCRRTPIRCSSARRPCSTSITPWLTIRSSTRKSSRSGQRQERSKSSGRRCTERKLTHIYVDWKEIQRHRQPGGYGFTDFVQPSEVCPLGRGRRARTTAAPRHRARALPVR